MCLANLFLILTGPSCLHMAHLATLTTQAEHTRWPWGEIIICQTQGELGWGIMPRVFYREQFQDSCVVGVHIIFFVPIGCPQCVQFKNLKGRLALSVELCI